MNSRYAALVASLAIGIGAPAQAATQMFVDVPGIPGESTSTLAPDQIIGLSYNFGVGPTKTTKFGTVGETAGFDACSTSAF